MGLLHANRDNLRRKYYELVKQQDQNNDIDDYSEYTTAESEIYKRQKCHSAKYITW